MAGPVAGGGGDELRRFRRLADLTAVVTFLLIVVGGIVPEADAARLMACGVAAVFTPKDYSINQIMGRVVEEIRKANRLP